MKKSDINIHNIKKFARGYTQRALDKLGLVPPYIKEQVDYRKSKCGDCLAKGRCKECGCSVPAKWYNKESCNKGRRFPALMSEDMWEDFKRAIRHGKEEL